MYEGDASLSPRPSGSYISQHAQHVSIDGQATVALASQVANAVQEGRLGYDAFKCNSIFPLDLQLSISQLINWTFAVDALNFNFWTPDGQPKFRVVHGSAKGAGYIGMVTAVTRAIVEGKPMYDPKYYGKLNINELKHIFRSETSSQMPLFNERVRILGEISAKLDEKYDSSFENVLKEAEGDALKLVEIVVREFDCFRDEAVYNGKRVSLYKRAQILAADLDVLLAVKEQPGLQNIDQLTMFADYRVPQVLLFYGVLKYTPELTNKLETEHLFENGCTEEVEIRGCSIEAVERLVSQCRDALVSRGWAADRARKEVTAVKVDFFLWDYRVQHAKQLLRVPYHRTRCIYY